jgi:mono/diheme cytochrome c family protein
MNLRQNIRILLAALCFMASASIAFGAAVSNHWANVPQKEHNRVSPLAGNPQAAQAGALIYEDHCAACHKSEARGDGHKRPALRDAQLGTRTDGELQWFIRQGDLRHGMPSWSGLPEEQRWQVIAYLRTLK